MFQVDRKQQAVIIIIAALVLFTAGYRVSRWQGDEYRDPSGTESIVKPAGGEGAKEIAVHVSGAVEKPGVYRFSREMRVQDALDRAVPLSGADVQSLNLAAPLKDGQKIVVPMKQGSAGPDGSGSRESLPSSVPAAATSQAAPAVKGPVKININRAGTRELESLPGVGPALAQRIVAHRESRGFFTSEEEIKDVPGIGEKLYEQIKNYISVN